ncbi:hypothetical protein [Dyella tabacisoli]|uniref:hypothetical protein n=1 Tax=Dyella tabacisoli TaxID=2282381 RepID=UPI0013B4382F|nr:hypothetical protein [Dyella tabacisoli]
MKSHQFIFSMLAMMPLYIGAHEVDSVCEVSKHPSQYIGRDIRLVGQIVVGMHGSSMVDSSCIENQIPLDIKSNGPAALEFDDIMSAKDQGNRSPPVSVAGRLEMSGNAFSFIPVSISRLNASVLERH